MPTSNSLLYITYIIIGNILLNIYNVIFRLNFKLKKKKQIKNSTLVLTND